MPKLPSIYALQKIIESVPIPAIAYAYAAPNEESKDEFASTSLTFGKKNSQSSASDINDANNRTQFPASSLSKIVFTYLILQLTKEKQIDLDEPLHDILQYERFKVDGKYPEKAKKLTARHVLSHTTGLPNFGSNLSSTLVFDSKSELGDGHFYSGEAFLYLQRTIEKKMGKDLEVLAQEYVFTPLKMERSTFAPQSKDDSNVVAVHTELGKSTPIYVGEPPINAAGSLLTTADDFSKFMVTWLDRIDDPIFKQAFESKSPDAFPTCGLGWHIYKNKDEVIAYQYGENPNTRSFAAINVKAKKAAAFFTNSENGMSVANQVLSSFNLAPIGDLQNLFKYMHYNQSDEPGWKETIAGKIAENQGEFEEARCYFEKALELLPEDKSKQLRLEWFNAAYHFTQKKIVTTSLKMFEGIYKNSYNDEIKIFINQDNDLIYQELDRKIKLVRISKTEFLPEKDQSFKIRFDADQMIISFVHGGRDKYLSRQCLTKSHQVNSYTVIASSLGHQPTHIAAHAKSSDPLLTQSSEEKQLDPQKPIKLEQVIELKPSTEHEEIQYHQLTRP